MGLNPGTGSIKFGGTEIVEMPTHKIVRMGMGYVPEDREIFASLTVKENLSLAARSKDSADAYKFVYDLFPRIQYHFLKYIEIPNLLVLRRVILLFFLLKTCLDIYGSFKNKFGSSSENYIFINIINNIKTNL